MDTSGLAGMVTAHVLLTSMHVSLQAEADDVTAPLMRTSPFAQAAEKRPEVLVMHLLR